MVARQAPGVVEAPLGVVRADVVRVSLGQPLDGVLDGPAGGGGGDTEVDYLHQKSQVQISTAVRPVTQVSRDTTKYPSGNTQQQQQQQQTTLGPYVRPPSLLISLVLKLVWQPAPFQLPVMGLGSKDTMTPKSSQTRCRMKRATHRWSPMLMPSVGPTWNSH